MEVRGDVPHRVRHRRGVVGGRGGSGERRADRRRAQRRRDLARLRSVEIARLDDLGDAVEDSARSGGGSDAAAAAAAARDRTAANQRFFTAILRWGRSKGCSAVRCGRWAGSHAARAVPARARRHAAASRRRRGPTSRRRTKARGAIEVVRVTRRLPHREIQRVELRLLLRDVARKRLDRRAQLASIGTARGRALEETQQLAPVAIHREAAPSEGVERLGMARELACDHGIQPQRLGAVERVQLVRALFRGGGDFRLAAVPRVDEPREGRTQPIVRRDEAFDEAGIECDLRRPGDRFAGRAMDVRRVRGVQRVRVHALILRDPAPRRRGSPADCRT